MDFTIIISNFNSLFHNVLLFSLKWTRCSFFFMFNTTNIELSFFLRGSAPLRRRLFRRRMDAHSSRCSREIGCRIKKKKKANEDVVKMWHRCNQEVAIPLFYIHIYTLFSSSSSFLFLPSHPFLFHHFLITSNDPFPPPPLPLSSFFNRVKRDSPLSSLWFRRRRGKFNRTRC